MGVHKGSAGSRSTPPNRTGYRIDAERPVARKAAVNFMVSQLTIERDEDGVWVAECHAIPGCVSQGRTLDEAVNNVRDAMIGCLEIRAELGLPLTVDRPHRR